VFQAVRERFVQAGIELEEVELTMAPSTPLELEPKDTIQVMGFIEQIEELDDVNKVYSNLHVSEAALAEYEASAA
jgi:transcriptional/translational regulatory protein YebC/TACO1